MYTGTPREGKVYKWLRDGVARGGLPEGLGPTQIGLQGGRDVDLSIRPLVGLEDADQRARERQARAVQGVNEAGLGALLLAVLEADPRAPRLEVAEVRARAD